MNLDRPGHADPARRARPVAGIELGGTKCVLTLAHGPGAVVDQRTVPTLHPEWTLPAIAAVLEEWNAAHGFSALGIASFGPIELDPASDRFGHILQTSKPHWPMTDVARRLAAPYPVPLAVDTDVNGAAVAEASWGCAQGLDDFAYVTVGTGVGVGLLVGGRTPRGLGHSEIGHLRVPLPAGSGWRSGCPYHADCVEGLASGTGIAAALGDVAVDTVPADHPVWEQVVHALGCMVHALACTTAPRRIAFGGGVLQRQPHLLARILPAARASINTYLTLPDEDYVVAPMLGDQAGPLGSVALALRALDAAR